MKMKAAAAGLGCFLSIAAASVVPAAASCSDRPGTPDNLSAEVTSATSIRFKFRITTRDNEVNKYYDYFVVEKPGNKQVRSQTGVPAHGPYFLGYGGITYFNVSDLKPGGEYCFQVKARTERGTQGCVSAKWSGPVCARIEGGPAARPKTTGPHAAVAADGKGHWGYAVGQPSDAQARESAVKGCANPGCKVELAGQWKCAAYATSRANGGYWYGLGLSRTDAGARSAAERGCAKGAPKGTCKAEAAFCAK